MMTAYGPRRLIERTIILKVKFRLQAAPQRSLRVYKRGMLAKRIEMLLGTAT
jgi:hypothetical protein